MESKWELREIKQKNGFSIGEGEGERERETVFFQVCSLPPIRASGAAPWSGEKNRAKRETRERRRQKESEFQLVDLLFSYFSYSFVRFLFLK